MMRVLLTGGAGFIGQHVLSELLARGHEVRVMDSLRPDVHRDGRAWTPPAGVELHAADIRDRGLDRAVDGHDAVIHLAAKVGLGVDVGDLPDYASSNDAGTAELLAAMARANVMRLTLASSMVVYGEGLGRCAGAWRGHARRRATQSALAAGKFEPPCPICGRSLETTLVCENAPLDPRNAYATSKVAQEYYAANWARTTGGSVAALRYHNVYGPGMPRDTPYAGVAAIFTSALRRGEAPKVFEDGRQRRDFVHVRDVASATVLACESTSRACAPSMSDPARRARSAIWRGPGRGAQRPAAGDRAIQAGRRPAYHRRFLPVARRAEMAAAGGVRGRHDRARERAGG